MNILIITDIFGSCHFTDKIISNLNNKLFNTHLCTPYNQEINFNSENDAYDYFINKIGKSSYSKKVEKIILEYKPNFIIAFSAGANALLEALLIENIILQEVFCFYPSALNKYIDLNTKTKINVFLPSNEVHFDVNQIKLFLKDKINFEIEIFDYKHGFMNDQSINYNKFVSEYLLLRIYNFLFLYDFYRYINFYFKSAIFY
jgi:hypothetical protein